MIPAFLLKNRPASILGGLALVMSIACGVQTVRLAWSQDETAEAKLAFANFKTRQAGLAASQAAEDARLSADLLQRQADRLAQLTGQSSDLLRGIEHASVTRSCGPVMRDASRGVQSLLRGGGAGPGGAAARPEPAAPLR